MNQSKPLVSVLMPVYNGEKYLREAIESILDQTFTRFEFIIIDDGSTDNTAIILDSYTDTRIIRIKHQNNMGIATSLNDGITKAKGMYIARMDADDWAFPDRFLKQIEYFQKHPKVGVLGSQMSIIDQDGEAKGNYRVPSSNGVILWSLLFGNPIAHPTVMLRRDLISKYGGYDTNYLASQDKELWVRLIDGTQFANLSENLVKYRRHPQSIWMRNPNVAHQISQKIGLQLASQFLGDEISSSVWNFIDCSQNARAILTSTEIEIVVALFLRLYMAFIDQVKLEQYEQTEIQADTIRRIIAIVNCDGRVSDDFLARAYWRKILPRFIWNFAQITARSGRAFKKRLARKYFRNEGK